MSRHPFRSSQKSRSGAFSHIPCCVCVQAHGQEWRPGALQGIACCADALWDHAAAAGIFAPAALQPAAEDRRGPLLCICAQLCLQHLASQCLALHCPSAQSAVTLLQDFALRPPACMWARCDVTLSGEVHLKCCGMLTVRIVENTVAWLEHHGCILAELCWIM